MSRIRSLARVLIVAGCASTGWGAYIPAKAALAQALLERAWMRTQHGETNVRPWPWADIHPVAEIDFPTLHEHDIVLEGASGQAMAFGPGRMPATAAIGANGTAVVAAH